jgi:hypothetical protein
MGGKLRKPVLFLFVFLDVFDFVVVIIIVILKKLFSGKEEEKISSSRGKGRPDSYRWSF